MKLGKIVATLLLVFWGAATISPAALAEEYGEWEQFEIGEGVAIAVLSDGYLTYLHDLCSGVSEISQVLACRIQVAQLRILWDIYRLAAVTAYGAAYGATIDHDRFTVAAQSTMEQAAIAEKDAQDKLQAFFTQYRFFWDA